MRFMGITFVLIFSLLLMDCEDKEEPSGDEGAFMQLVSVRAGAVDLKPDQDNLDIPVDENIAMTFNEALDTTTVPQNISLLTRDSIAISIQINYLSDNKTLSVKPEKNLDYYSQFFLSIGEGIESIEGHTFPGTYFQFTTRKGNMSLKSISLNNKNFKDNRNLKNIDFSIEIRADFNRVPDLPDAYSSIQLKENANDTPLDITLASNDSTLLIKNTSELNYYKKYTLSITEDIVPSDTFEFSGFSNSFYTRLDSTPKFPQISDEELLTKIQEQTFRYFWDFGHPNSGLARERNTSGDVVTAGGSGFGIMSIIVGIERGFITRQQGLNRLDKILDFLENDADRFHGAWPHWMNGNTGEVIPFSQKDDGGDLVETAFLLQGLLTFRQYLDPASPQEDSLITQINRLWESVEWDWYTKGEDVLYWHWSPTYDFEMNLPVRGYNETLITYILAAASPTHGISDTIYHIGFAQEGGMVNGNTYYGYTLPLGTDYGGPLFFEHYSFLGLDPRNLQDQYANYWKQAVNHAKINHAYCADNPNGYLGYDESSWGLTASDNYDGYSAHSPTNDLGVITPTAAIASIPYTPERSMDAIRRFYYILGDRMWGEYGFYDAFSPQYDWYADSYIAIDQGPIILMIENYRTGLLWNLFMSAPEIQNSLDKLGFNY